MQENEEHIQRRDFFKYAYMYNIIKLAECKLAHKGLHKRFICNYKMSIYVKKYSMTISARYSFFHTREN